MNIYWSPFKYYGNLDCYSILFLFFRPLHSWGLLILYSLLKAIVVLHLLIIWIPTWVLVLSDTTLQPSVSCGGQGSTVHRSSSHKCGQKSSCNAFNAVVAASPWIFCVSFFPTGLWGTSLLLMPIGGSFWLPECIFELHSSRPRRLSSSDRPPDVPCLWELNWKSL